METITVSSIVYSPYCTLTYIEIIKPSNRIKFSRKHWHCVSLFPKHCG